MTTRSRRRSKSPFRFMHRGGGGSHSPSPARVPSNIATTTIRATSSNGSINGSMNGTATSGSIEEKRASPAKDCQTPDRPRSTASCSSGSSNGMTPSSSVMLEGILATTPSLPKVVQVRRVNLRKRPPDDPISGWGFVLRGTTSEFKNGVKVYTCHVETVKDGSAAMVRRESERKMEKEREPDKKNISQREIVNNPFNVEQVQLTLSMYKQH